MVPLRRFLFFVLPAFVVLGNPSPSHAWMANGVALCAAPNDQTSPVAISDGAGGAIVAWLDFRYGSTVGLVYAQHLLASGAADPAWPRDGKGVAPGGGPQFEPSIVSDGTNGAIIAFADSRSSSSSSPGLYAQHVLTSGGADPAWPFNGALFGIHGAFPVLTSDGNHGAIVAWEDYTADGTTNVYAQHVRQDGSADPAWPALGLAVCTAPYDQVDLKVVADGAGGGIIAWEDRRSGGDVPSYNDIYAHHVLSSGAVDPAWPLNGLALCTAPGFQGALSMVPDGAGGAIAFWQDNRDDPNDHIYTQHALSTGVADPAWPADGLALYTAAGFQGNPAGIPDGTGAAIVTWQDHRNGTDYDVYALHLLVSGAADPSWPAGGVAVCTAPGSQERAQIVSDGQSGAIVTWLDGRNGTSDIYAQHVLDSGVLDPAWPVNGSALCTAITNDRGKLTLIGDGVHGAIAVWQDYRSGNSYDIYAQRIYSSGEVAAVPLDEKRTRFSLGAPSPNPALDRVSIRFDLPSAQPVLVEVFDLAGHRVRVLARNQELTAGTHSVSWEGSNDVGARVADGIYLVRVQGSHESAVQKVVLLH